jgi:hypothetical protein
MKGFVHLTLVLATAAVCGCADAGTSPTAALVGTFVLASYNGTAVPTYVEPRLGACSSMIVGGSLITAADGHVVFARSYSTPCTPGAPVNTEARTGTVSVAGAAITINLDANALNSAQTYTGTLAGAELTLNYTVANLTTPLDQVFVLVRQ